MPGCFGLIDDPDKLVSWSLTSLLMTLTTAICLVVVLFSYQTVICHGHLLRGGTDSNMIVSQLQMNISTRSTWPLLQLLLDICMLSARTE